MAKFFKRLFVVLLIFILLLVLAWGLNYLYDSSMFLQDLFGSTSANQSGLRVPTDDPAKVELFMPVFGGKISLFIFTLIIVMQFAALFIAAKVIKKIVKSDMTDSCKLASFKNADIFLDLPLYIGLFGSVSSFLLISFSPQSSRLVAYSSTLIGIIFSVISRLGILFPAKQKILAAVDEQSRNIKD